jgi:hypothetical protein
MTTTVALRISVDTVELITVLNGGVRPGDITFGKYYACDITDGVTSNRKFIDFDTYRIMRANTQALFAVSTFQS